MQSLGTAQSPIMKVTNVMTSGAMPIPQLTSAFPPGPLDLRLDQQEALDTITSAYARGMRRALVDSPSALLKRSLSPTRFPSAVVVLSWGSIVTNSSGRP
jgi:hypothetical protein